MRAAGKVSHDGCIGDTRLRGGGEVTLHGRVVAPVPVSFPGHPPPLAERVRQGNDAALPAGPARAGGTGRQSSPPGAPRLPWLLTLAGYLG